jgi:hypothetical protein
MVVRNGMHFNISNRFKSLLGSGKTLYIYLNNGEKNEVTGNVTHEDGEVFEYTIPQGNLSTEVVIFKNQIVKIETK